MIRVDQDPAVVPNTRHPERRELLPGRRMADLELSNGPGWRDYDRLEKRQDRQDARLDELERRQNRWLGGLAGWGAFLTILGLALATYRTFFSP